MEAMQLREIEGTTSQGSAVHVNTLSLQSGIVDASTFEHKLADLQQKQNTYGHRHQSATAMLESLLEGSQQVMEKLRVADAERVDLLGQRTRMDQYFNRLLQEAGVDIPSSTAQKHRALEVWIRQAASNRSKSSLFEEMGIPDLKCGLGRLRTAFEASLQASSALSLQKESEKVVREKAIQERATAKLNHGPEQKHGVAASPRVKNHAHFKVSRCAGYAISGCVTPQPKITPVEQRREEPAEERTQTIRTRSEEVMKLELEVQSKNIMLSSLENSQKFMGKKLAEADLLLKDCELRQTAVNHRNTQLLTRVAQLETQALARESDSILCGATQEKLEGLNSQIRKLKIELDSEKTQRASENAHAQKEKQKYVTALSELEQSAAKISELETKLEASREKIESEQARCASLADSLLRQQQKHVVDMQCLTDELEEEKKQSLSISLELERASARLKKLFGLEQECAQLRVDCNNLKSRMGSVSEELDQLHTKYNQEKEHGLKRQEEAESTIKSLQQQLHSNEKTQIEDNQELTALNQQVQTLLENRIKLQQELGLALSSQSHLQGSVDNLEQQLANATSKLAVLQSERDCAVAIVSESNKQHQLEYKQLQESYNIAEEENREAGGTIQLLNEEKVEYMFKLDTLTSLVAARQAELERAINKAEEISSIHEETMQVLRQQFTDELAKTKEETGLLSSKLSIVHEELEKLKTEHSNTVPVCAGQQRTEQESQTQYSYEVALPEQPADLVIESEPKSEVQQQNTLVVHLDLESDREYIAEQPPTVEDNQLEHKDDSTWTKKEEPNAAGPQPMSQINQVPTEEISVSLQPQVFPEDVPHFELVTTEAHAVPLDTHEQVELDEQMPAALQQENELMQITTVPQPVQELPCTDLTVQEVQYHVPPEEIAVGERQVQTIKNQLQVQSIEHSQAQQDIVAAPSKMEEPVAQKGQQHLDIIQHPASVQQQTHQAAENAGIISPTQLVEPVRLELEPQSTVMLEQNQPAPSLVPIEDATKRNIVEAEVSKIETQIVPEPPQDKPAKPAPPPFFASEGEDGTPKFKEEMPPPIDLEGILQEPVLDLGSKTVKSTVLKPKKKKKMSKKILVNVIGDGVEEEPDS